MKVNEFSLNSTMVRLKRIKGGVKIFGKNWSQFHYGSIKTFRWLCYVITGNQVSIPLWFD